MRNAVRDKKLKIAIIAPPWLSTGPRCYFGIENMVHYLTMGLVASGHNVELFTVGDSVTEATKLHWYHNEQQYQHIHRPYYQTSTIIISHILYALNLIRKTGDFDIIHDHNDYLGPAIMAYGGDNLPPILHTIHEPFTNLKLVARGIPDNRLMYEQFKSIKDMYFNTVSDRQIKDAPEEIRRKLLGVIYNGINVEDYTFEAKKQDFFLSVGSIKKDKGQGAAAQFCQEIGVQLKIAGIVAGGLTNLKGLLKEQANPSSSYQGNSDFKYFISDILPYLAPGQIEYIGVISGDKKLKLFSKAKALLMPVDWEEPFGIVNIEALASGTPVVSYRKGAMPEIIEHGVNGFLAHNEKEFKFYMQRVGDIDPEACRASVIKKFSSTKMAREYEKRYQEIISKRYR